MVFVEYIESTIRMRPNFGDTPIIQINPGEHFVGHSGVVVKTLLGSCISVCLYDAKNRICAMNHFLLASDKLNRADILISRAGYYGICAMELVINGMLKLGSEKRHMQCKIFGGASMLTQFVRNVGEFKTVGEQNIAFVLEFLKNENIPISAQDVGGVRGRVIHFNTNDYFVYRALITHSQEPLIEENEFGYYKNVSQQLLNPKPSIKIWE